MFRGKNRFFGIFGTLGFHVLLLLFFIFVGFTTPLPIPLIEGQGMEVNLGNSEDGMGDIQPEELSDNTGAMPELNTNQDEELLASENNTEEAIKIIEKKKEISTPVIKQKEVVKEVVKINPLSLFNVKKDGKNGGNEGTTGKPGDQGNPFGDPNATNHVGNPGSGGNGSGGNGNGGGAPSFSLKGRVSKSLPKPDYNSKEQGIVVVKIWVNINGEVTRVEAGQRGTTSSDRALWKQAENAAMRAHFSPDPNAPEDQTGTITYKFIRLN
ncbi:MAG: energy transducer TonB [Bacteroidota bacterium]